MSTQGYGWNPIEIAEWRLWADNQPDSITRNKIHELLNAYEGADEIEAGKEESQHLASAVLEIVKELTPIIRAGVRKNATPESREETEELIRELIANMTMILNWDFKGEQKSTVITLNPTR